MIETNDTAEPSGASAGSLAKPSGVAAACAAAADIGLAMQTVEGFEPVKLPQWEMVGEGTDGTPIYRNNWGAYGQWIPVGERLPEPGLGVLIFFRATDEDGTPSCIGCDGNGGLITIAAMDRIDGQHLWTSEYGDETPTHWMPLPAPPTDAK